MDKLRRKPPGAIFPFVTAAVHCGGAEGFRKLTGVWSGN